MLERANGWRAEWTGSDDKAVPLHREAQARRDYDAIMETFTRDCYLETVALGLRSNGRDAARTAYVGYVTSFPDLAPDDHGSGARRRPRCLGVLQDTSGGDWLGVPPSRGSFAVPFTSVSTFKDERMASESTYFDLATLCEQAGLPLTGSERPPTPERA